MAHVWLGDNRIIPFKEFCEETEDVNNELVDEAAETVFKNFFISDVRADSTWLNTTGLTRLANVPENAESISVILTPGVSCCLDPLIYSSTSVEKSAINYAKAVDSIIDIYTESQLKYDFYLCTVGPVDSDYPCSLCKDDKITKTRLNEAIKTFNNKVKDKCKAKILDCHAYLESTGYETLDGVVYTADTSKSLCEYIVNNSQPHASVLFTPRFTEPPFVNADGSVAAGAEYYIQPIAANNNVGYNPFAIITVNNKYQSIGSTLPNCTAYAWGRFYEIIKTRPKLFTGNAETWYGASNTLVDDIATMALNGTAYDGYRRGQTPEPGAILCWEGVDGKAGHVAIVEQVNDDGSIITSESGYESASFWWLKKRTLDTQISVTYENGVLTETGSKSTGTRNNWGAGSTYRFQGFIYCPVSTGVSKQDLCTRNSYGISRKEMEPNATYIWQYLGTRGWTMEAVAGLLGNIEQESMMSPCVWEGCIKGSIINETTGEHTLNAARLSGWSGGYGLTQWTPYSKYTNWCSERGLKYWDMDSQLERIIYEIDNGIQWGLASYNYGYKYKDEAFDNLSFKDFMISTKDPGWLAAAFAYCYEKSWFTDYKDSDDNGNSPGLGLTVDEERLAVCTSRDANAQHWYTFLKSLPPLTMDDQLQLGAVKAGNITDTSVEISAVVVNATEAWYRIGDESDKHVLEILENFTSFELTGLVPNNEYTIVITAKGKDESEIIKELTFTTKQSLPKVIAGLKLSAADSMLPNKKLKLDVTEVSDVSWGYWGKPINGGFELQLIVNGKLLKTQIKGSKAALQEITLSSICPSYKSRLGDIVQIGIRAYVKDNAQKTIYDNTAAILSNALCFLAKPATVYIQD